MEIRNRKSVFCLTITLNVNDLATCSIHISIQDKVMVLHVLYNNIYMLHRCISNDYVNYISEL